MSIVRDVKIDITIDDLLRVHGAGNAAGRINRRALEIYGQVLDEAVKLIKPVLLYEAVNVAGVDDGRLTLESGHSFEVRIMAKLMRTARQVYFLCCTIGPALEQRVAEYQREGAPAKAYVLDSVGSLAVDLLAQAGCRLVDDFAESEGLSTSVALSPGYAGWPLTDQRILFQIMEASEIGVSLNRSCIMSPLKSTTLAVGMGPGLGGKSKGTSCDYCALKKTCNFRKERAS
jgi:hypothetical protein